MTNVPDSGVLFVVHGKARLIRAHTHRSIQLQRTKRWLRSRDAGPSSGCRARPDPARSASPPCGRTAAECSVQKGCGGQGSRKEEGISTSLGVSEVLEKREKTRLIQVGLFLKPALVLFYLESSHFLNSPSSAPLSFPFSWFT